MKIAVIGMLAVGVIWVAPTMHMPAFTAFIHGGGPIIPGTLFPYLFITIACGAISGFYICSRKGCTWHGLNKNDLENIRLEDSLEW